MIYKYDYSKLNGKIVEVFGTKKKFAQSMNKSQYLPKPITNVVGNSQKFQKLANCCKSQAMKLIHIFLNIKFKILNKFRKEQT